MDNPFVIWLAGLLGWDAGPVVSLLTVLIIVLYFVFFWILIQVAFATAGAFSRAEGVQALLWFFPLVVFGFVLLVLDTIHTLLLIWFGYSAMSAFRDWWHKGGL